MLQTRRQMMIRFRLLTGKTLQCAVQHSLELAKTIFKIEQIYQTRVLKLAIGSNLWSAQANQISFFNIAVARLWTRTHRARNNVKWKDQFETISLKTTKTLAKTLNPICKHDSVRAHHRWKVGDHLLSTKIHSIQHLQVLRNYFSSLGK